MLSMIATWAAAPRIESITVQGDLPFPQAQARRLVHQRAGSAFHPEVAQVIAERLRQACRRHAHPLAHVTWQALPGVRTNHVALTYQVDPGPHGHLREVRFSGNLVIPDHELASQITVRPRSGLWEGMRTGSSPFDLDVLGRDRAALERSYTRQGYAAVEIGPAIIDAPSDLNGFRITWPIEHEGPIYALGHVGIDADAELPHALWRALIGLQTGDRFNSERIISARARLQEDLLAHGYAFAAVHVDSQRDDQTRHVDLVFTVDAGTRPRMRHLRIEGLKATHPRIVAREVNMQAGDHFQGPPLLAAQAQLRALPLFASIELEVERVVDDAELFDLRIEVEERPTGRMEAGLIYGDVQGGALQANLRELNLALQPPFRGHALQAELGGTLGPRIRRMQAGLRNPRMGFSYWSLGGSGYGEDNTYLSRFYNQRSGGGRLSAGHPLGTHQRVTIGYVATTTRTYDVDERFVTVDRGLETRIALTALTLDWVYDHSDHPMRPMRGMRLGSGIQIGHHALGGNLDVVLTRITGAIFINPWIRHVIEVRGGVRGISAFGDTEQPPESLRLYLGGLEDLRGFGYRTVAPIGETGLPEGGQTAWWTSIEYRMPVSPRLIAGVYLDAGEVSHAAYTLTDNGPVVCAGIGLQVRADNFPVRFDLATPLTIYDDDPHNETGRFKFAFSAGYRF